MSGRTGFSSGCTLLILLAALAVSAGTDGTEPAHEAANEAAHTPSTQLLTPFGGSDDGWERISLKSSVDRMMEDPEEGNGEDARLDLSADHDDDDDFGEFDDDDEEGGEEEDEWDSEDGSSEHIKDPLVNMVLPESYKEMEREKAKREEQRDLKAQEPSTKMEDDKLLSFKLRKQVEEEMGSSPKQDNEDEDEEQDRVQAERSVKDILVHERKHTLSLKKQLEQAKAQAAAAKEKSQKLEKKLRQVETGKVKKPLQMKKDKSKFVETEKKTVGKVVDKEMKKELKKEKKAAKKAKKKAKKKAAAKKAKKAAKKLLAKAKANLRKAHKVSKKTQKRIKEWASKQAIDDPEDAFKGKNKAQEKLYKKRIEGDHRNRAGKWANKNDYYSEGYISNDEYTDSKGHYFLGMSRRRIGAGFARRRRGTGFTPGKWVGKVHAKMLKKIVKGHTLLKVGLKRSKSLNGRKPAEKKIPLPPGIMEAEPSKLSLNEIKTLKKTKAGVNAKVDKTAHFTGATIAKIGGKGLAASLGEKAKAAKNTAKLSAKVKKLVDSALKKVASAAKKKSAKKSAKAPTPASTPAPTPSKA